MSEIFNVSDLDLSSEEDGQISKQNNVYVISEENMEKLIAELPADAPIGTKPQSKFKQYDERILNLLRGKTVTTQDDKAVQEKLFKLLTITELDQAIVNISYYFDLRKIVPESAFSSFKAIGLEDIGLYYNKKDQCIEGVPTRLGTFQIGIQFNVKGSPFSKLLNINVITLWKEIDPPSDLPFPKSNQDSSSLIVDEFKRKGLKNIVAASKRGRSHAYDGKPRDDDFTIDYCEKSGWYIVAVCDGAGSAKLSREGSRILSKKIDDVFMKNFADEKINEVIEHIVENYLERGDAEDMENNLLDLISPIVRTVIVRTLTAFKKQAKELKLDGIYPFSTTCLLSFFKKIKGNWLVFSYNVGDGAIAMVDEKQHTAAILCNPDEGKYFGQTRFITTEGVTDISDVRSRIVIKYVRDFDALILMTDGVSDPKFESDKNLNDARRWVDFWADMTKEVDFYGTNDEQEEQLLKYLDFWSIGNHDDRTIVVVY